MKNKTNEPITTLLDAEIDCVFGGTMSSAISTLEFSDFGIVPINPHEPLPIPAPPKTKKK